ncbi:MAG: tetratricopeptide repeat-containing sensor histidine kinase [Bacteroidales bacterium]|nr:tetratricopeptide repeat-containing sensor histidine kinase [Bacteroidales bacterium]MBN2820555.1 tetratricopeptide repeat-containing sensor histidine kinase [Bacteroidales bacterium]
MKNRLQSVEDISVRCQTLYDLAFKIGNPDSAIYFSNQIVANAKNQNNNFWLQKGYYALGNSLSEKGDYDESIEALFVSTRLCEKNFDTIGKAKCYLTIGGVYTLAKNYKNALVYFDLAIKTGENKLDYQTLAAIYLNSGSLFLMQKKYRNAIEYYHNAYSIYHINHDIKGMAYCLNNIGRIEYELGNKELAFEKIKVALNLLLEIDDKYGFTVLVLHLAKFEYDSKYYQDAKTHAKKGYDLAIKYGFLPQQRDASTILLSIYEETNEYKKAFKYQKIYHDLNDSLINLESVQKMADLRTEFEVSQKQAEIDLLIKEKKIQKTIGISLATILLLFAGLVFVLLRNSKRNKELLELLTDQKEELLIQHDKLAELNETKSRFFSIISHDLRGPIGLLNGTTMLIRDYLESKDYKQLEDVTSNMEFTVKKVQFLLDNLLEWALSQQNQFQYQPEMLELNELIHDVMSVFEDMALSKAINLKYICKFDQFYIIADRNSLMTIIRNLLSNAIKFTNRKGHVSLTLIKQKDSAVIMVDDDGVGIPQKKLENLFKIEQKKSTWGTDREKGLGIGLNLVYEFVQLNKGTIDVESQVGKGTRFTIKLPSEIIQADSTPHTMKDSSYI